MVTDISSSNVVTDISSSSVVIDISSSSVVIDISSSSVVTDISNVNKVIDNELNKNIDIHTIKIRNYNNNLHKYRRRLRINVRIK